MKLTSLKPFVPSGKGFSIAKSFFPDIGFTENSENDDTCELHQQHFQNDSNCAIVTALHTNILIVWEAAGQASQVISMLQIIVFNVVFLTLKELVVR